VDELSGTMELALTVRWTTGGCEEEAELPPDVIFDEDEWEYVMETSVTLGPLEACLLPWSERPEGAVCRWSVPSDCWDMGLGITQEDGRARLGVSMDAGDVDTSGSQSLPLESVPIGSPWTIDYHPDNAGGGWGDVTMELQRVAPEADCCVACTVGKPCGNTCIEASLECHRPAGCACAEG
jgi:hypothetical protein